MRKMLNLGLNALTVYWYLWWRCSAFLWGRNRLFKICV